MHATYGHLNTDFEQLHHLQGCIGVNRCSMELQLKQHEQEQIRDLGSQQLQLQQEQGTLQAFEATAVELLTVFCQVQRTHEAITHVQYSV